MLPHWRQWCLRTVNENCLSHFLQATHCLSSAHCLLPFNMWFTCMFWFSWPSSWRADSACSSFLFVSIALCCVFLWCSSVDKSRSRSADFSSLALCSWTLRTSTSPFSSVFVCSVVVMVRCNASICLVHDCISCCVFVRLCSTSSFDFVVSFMSSSEVAYFTRRNIKVHPEEFNLVRSCLIVKNPPLIGRNRPRFVKSKDGSACLHDK